MVAPEFRRFGSSGNPLQYRRAHFYLGILVGAAVVALCIVWSCKYGYYSTFSRFMSHDDEGTMIYIARTFFANRHDASLMDSYGPCYYLYKYILHLVFKIPMSNENIRLCMLVCWVTAAGLCSIFTYQLSRSLPLAALSYLQGFLHLNVLANEPGHPQELIAVFVSLSMLCAALTSSKRLRGAALFLLGAAVSVVALSKINVGGFVGFAVLLALLLNARHTWLHNIGSYVVGAVLLCLPALLMWRHLGFPWAVHYCVAVTCALLAALSQVFLAAPRGGTVGRRELLLVVLGGLAVVLVAAVFLFSGGARLSGVLEGMVLTSLRLPSVYFDPAKVDQKAVVSGLSAIVLSLTAVFVGTRANLRSGFRWPLVVVRLCFCIFVYYVAMYKNLWQDNLLLSVATPFFWLVLLPSSESSGSTFAGAFPRIVLCFSGILASLQAYPVHGSQAYLATFLLLPAAAVCAADAWREVVREVSARVAYSAWWSHAAALLILVAILGAYYRKIDPPTAKARYDALSPLNLPGTERIRLRADYVGLYQWLSNNVQAHCDDFISWPGMPSLHLWSGVKQTVLYGSAWLALESEEQEQKVLERLGKPGRHCVLYNEKRAQAWLRERSFAKTPFFRYVDQAYDMILRTGGYSVLITREHSRSESTNFLLYGEHVFHKEEDGFLGLPIGMVSASTSFSIRLWLRTTTSGAVLGYQLGPRAGRQQPSEWTPLLYVGTDGRLRAQLWNGHVRPLTAEKPVNDGAWHHVVLVAEDTAQRLYVDGALVARLDGKILHRRLACAQVGTAYGQGWPEADQGWFDFDGVVKDVVLEPTPLSQEQVSAYILQGP
jgi:hypothetical protein